MRFQRGSVARTVFQGSTLLSGCVRVLRARSTSRCAIVDLVQILVVPDVSDGGRLSNVRVSV